MLVRYAWVLITYANIYSNLVSDISPKAVKVAGACLFVFCPSGCVNFEGNSSTAVIIKDQYKIIVITVVY